MDHLAQHIESLIFCASSPINITEIKSCLDSYFETNVKIADIENALELLQTRYRDERYSFEIVEIGNAYQFLSKGAFFDTIAIYLKQRTRRRLSKSALETLAIIAYKQPVTKSELEAIRGVGCDYSLQKLLDKELITIIGRSEGPGRPLLYSTSDKFMDYFGLKSIKDLPKLKEFDHPEYEIGEPAPIEETAQN